jgi:hypothetical protein
MNDTYDLADLDSIWSQGEPLLRRDVEVDFGLDERPVLDDEPVVEDPPEVVWELGADFQVRKMLTNLFVIAFAAALIAGLLGALVNIAAPNDYMHRARSP